MFIMRRRNVLKLGIFCCALGPYMPGDNRKWKTTANGLPKGTVTRSQALKG
jgi:hypothetical protein